VAEAGFPIRFSNNDTCGEPYDKLQQYPSDLEASDRLPHFEASHVVVLVAEIRARVHDAP
jgi:hypothetical protein